MNTHFKTIDGIDVFITEDGKFTAKINKRDVTKPNFRDIEKLVAQTLEAVTAYELDRYEVRLPRKVEILKFEKDRVRLKDGDLGGHFSHYYKLTEEQIGFLNDLVRQRDEIKDAWHEYVNLIEKQRVTTKNLREPKSE